MAVPTIRLFCFLSLSTFELSKSRSVRQKVEASCTFQNVDLYGEERARILEEVSSMLAYYHTNTPLPDSYFMEDKMGWHEKLKILLLSGDLFRESLLKMRQIINIREEHDVFMSYNVGMLMGRIREKYRFMSETYRDIVDSYNASWMRPPGVRYYRPLHFIIALERMHYLELEIDKLVDVMVDEATHDLRSNWTIVGQTDPRRSSRRNRERHDYDDTTKYNFQLRSQKDIINEEAEKSIVRQRFLMKKLGNPANMTTTKKRFLRKWPVEDSWSLDKYNHDYK